MIKTTLSESTRTRIESDKAKDKLVSQLLMDKNPLNVLCQAAIDYGIVLHAGPEAFSTEYNRNAFLEARAAVFVKTSSEQPPTFQAGESSVEGERGVMVAALPYPFTSDKGVGEWNGSTGRLVETEEQASRATMSNEQIAEIAEKAGCAELQKHLPSSVRALVRTALTEYERIKNTSGTREN